MRLIFPIIMLVLLLGVDVYAQDPQWRNEVATNFWEDHCLANLNDDKGNSYFFNSISDTNVIKVQDGDRVRELNPKIIVLQHIDRDGKTVWTQTFSDEVFCSASMDDLGNLFYIGYGLDSTSNAQFFLKKLFPSGTLISETKLFQPVSNERMKHCRVNKLLIDQQGDILLSGVFSDTLSTNSKPSETAAPTAFNGYNYPDPFVTKLDRNGNTLWYKNILGGGYNELNDAEIDVEGNIYITGTFSKRIRVDNEIFESKGGGDSFIYKISNSGDPILFQVLSGTDYDRINGIAVDAEQNMYISGSYGGQVEFDSKNISQQYKAIGYSDAFLLKLNPTGDFKWVRTIGDKSRQNESYTVQLINDNVYWIGKFQGQIDFDPRSTVLKLTSKGNKYDRYPTPFIQTYTLNGDFLDAISLNDYSADEFKMINILNESTYQITGRHFVNREEKNQYYALAIDQHQFQNQNDSIISVVACDSYYWDINKTKYTKSGIYTADHPSTKEPVELHLKIYEMNTNLKFERATLYSKEEDATYQWLNCVDGCKPIPNAKSYSYRPEKTGDYCVQLTSKLCGNIDTSKVRHIEILEIDQRTLDRYYELNYNITIDDIEKVHLPLDGEKVKMIPFRVDEFYGFVKNCDPDTWIVKPKFEQVFAVYETGAIVKDTLTEGYGFIDNNGKYVIPPYFSQITREQNVLHGINIFVSNSELHLPPSHKEFNYHAFFDMNGQPIFEERAHDQGNFSGEDYAWFRFGQKVHIRDLKGVMVDSFTVDTTKRFLGVANSNLIFSFPGESWQSTIKAYSLDRQLQFQMPLNTSGKVYQINDNLFGVSDAYDYSYYFVDKKGKGSKYHFSEGPVHEMLMSEMYFHQKYFIVWHDELEKCGVIDRSGKTVVPFKYSSIDSRVNGYWVCFDKVDRAHFIDSTGKIVFVDKEPMIQGRGREVNRYMIAGAKGFHEGLSFAWRQHYTVDDQGNWKDSSYYYYYDILGNELLSLDTSILLTGNFSEGLAPVVTTSKDLGFINKKGEIVIQPNYELVVAGGYLNMFFIVPRFKGGFAYVKSHKGYIDKNGKEYFSGKRMQDHYDFSH